MNWAVFLSQYTWWHYHAGFMSLCRHAFNLPRLVWQVFAPIGLLQNLLLPLDRLREPYQKRASWQEWVSSFIVNSLMRVVGAVIRISLLVVGIISLAIASITALLLVGVWVIMPVFVVGLIGLAIMQM